MPKVLEFDSTSLDASKPTQADLDLELAAQITYYRQEDVRLEALKPLVDGNVAAIIDAQRVSLESDLISLQ